MEATLRYVSDWIATARVQAASSRAGVSSRAKRCKPKQARYQSHNNIGNSDSENDDDYIESPASDFLE